MKKSRMQVFIFGLGNTGEEYRDTRHNVGRDFLFFVAKKLFGAKEEDWGFDKKSKALIYKGETEDQKKIALIIPETFMNISGKTLAGLPKSVVPKNVIVIHDDLDLPLGTVKLSFGKSSGGHKGVESMIKALKSKDFHRIRIGISPKTSSGKIKKPASADLVIKHVLGKFTSAQKEELKLVYKQVLERLPSVI